MILRKGWCTGVKTGVELSQAPYLQRKGPQLDCITGDFKAAIGLLEDL